MAGDWIPIDHDLPDKPEFLAIVEATSETVIEILFRLFCLWRMADRQTTDGILTGVGPNALAARCGGTAAFWETVEKVTKTPENPDGWLVFEDGSARIPRFTERFGKSAKRRISDARRKKSDARAEKMRRKTPQRLRKDSANENEKEALGHENDGVLRTDCGGACGKKVSPEPEPEPHSGEVRSGEDHVSVLEDSYACACASEDPAAFAVRKFLGRRAIIGKGARPADKDSLLKLSTLCVSGQIPEAWIDSGMEAIRHRTLETPIKRPVGYLMSVIRSEADKSGVNLNRLLATVKLRAKPNPVGDTQ